MCERGGGASGREGCAWVGGENDACAAGGVERWLAHQLHAVFVAVACSVQQHARAMVVGRIDVGAAGEQHAGTIELLERAAHHQCSGSVAGTQVGREAELEEKPHAADMTASYRHRQSVVAVARRTLLRVGAS